MKNISDRINLKKCCISMLFIMISQVFYGQQMPNIIPPSPEAAQLTKFVETPVSHYKGTPNINIPLFEVKAGNLTLPISISYHSKGIQVGEVASRVGLGWALNAGGAITRQVRDYADETTGGAGGGYMTKNFTVDFETNSNTRIPLLGQDANGVNFLDMDPDLYMFNFLGFSGKLIFDHVTKEPIVQKYEDLKFHAYKEGHKVIGWKITDNQGNQYFFMVSDKRFYSNNYESSVANGGEAPLEDDASGNFPNAWYLTKIVAANKEEIIFNYFEEMPVVYNVGSIKKATGSSSGVVHFSQTTSFQNQLESIYYPQGSIHFERYTEPRLDVGGYGPVDSIYPKALWKAIQKDKNNTVIKTYVFNHDYVTCENDGNILPYLNIIDNYAKKRLYLSSIDQYDNSYPSPSRLTYSFEYNPLKLPNRHSSSQDVWGYYNGKDNGDPVNNFLYMSKSVSPTHTGAGMLTRINYPTGGYTEFEYEQNTTALLDFADSIAMPYNDANGIPKQMGLIKNYANYQSSPFTGYSKDLIIEGTEPAWVESEINFSSIGNCIPGVDDVNCRYVILITSQDQTSVIAQLPLGDEQIMLLPGNYKLVVKLNHGAHHPNQFFEEEEFSVVLNWTELKNYIVVGGKRIKSITKGEDNIVHLKKEYTYEDENGYTSGKLLSLPDIYYTVVELSPNQVIHFDHPVVRSMTPGSSSGGQIGYSRVTEKTIGDGNIGKTVYTFTNYQDTGTYYKFPYHYPNDMEWARGLPVEVKQYKFENGNYQLLNEVKNIYQFQGNCHNPDFTNPVNCFLDPEETPPSYPSYHIDNFKFSYPIYRFGSYLEPPAFGSTGMDHDNYRISFFIGGRMHLQKTEERNYFNNELVYTEHHYLHDSPHHTGLKEKSTTSSAGEALTTHYFYPKDPQMSGRPYVQDLIAENMIGTPLVTQTYNNAVKLSEQETQYVKLNNLLLPGLIKTSKGEDATEVRIRYTAYDTYGNPLEVQQENGIPISYIWGYNHTEPVAKIENLAYNSIPSNLITAIHSATNQSDMFTALAALRNDMALANAMITTYMYKPLVGVYKITDPKGYTTTYHYDNFNRLEKVTDMNNNILSENKYHYRTQN